MEPTYANEVAPVFGLCFIGIIVVVGLASLVFTILVWWKKFSKAGYSGAMSLLMLVPIGNIVVLLILAFGQWPVLRELQAMKHGQMAPPPAGQPHESFRGN